MDQLRKNLEIRSADNNAIKNPRKPYEKPRMETLGSFEEFTRETYIKFSIE